MVHSKGSREPLAISSRAGSRRVEPRSSARRNQAGYARREGERGGHRDHRPDVGRAHSIEQRRNQATAKHRSSDADDYAHDHEAKPLPHDHPAHRRRIAAKRQPDADLTGVLIDEVGHHAVNADDGQDQCGQREHRDENTEVARGHEGVRDELVARCDVRQSNCRIQFLHRPPQVRRDCRGIFDCPQDDVRAGKIDEREIRPYRDQADPARRT